jgi:hypothetical protein
MPTNNAKYTFIYLLSLVGLVFVAVPSAMVLFQLINKFIPDPASSSFSQEPVKFAIAALLVASPLYYWTMAFLNRSLLDQSLEKGAAARRWLTYLILFVAAVIVIGWLIGTINVFLSGELTMRFILKLLTVLAIAGTIFSYYFWDSKREIIAHDKVNRAFLFGSLAAVILCFGSAWLVVDSPKVARAHRMDQNIINDLTQIDSALNTYYNDNKKLPATLTELVSSRYYLASDNLSDDTKAAYEYRVISDKNYELCANFQLPNPIDNNYMYDKVAAERWQHPTGRHCFNVLAVATPAAMPVMVK